METKKRSFFAKIVHFSTAFMQKFLPDAYIFAAVLTFIVFIACLIFTKQSPVVIVAHWGNGVWGLLAFSMQMVFVLVSGHTLALAPPVKRLLNFLSDIPKTPSQGILYVSVISYTACILNWGFGLVIGAIYAKEIARKIRDIDYRLLIASAYSGFVLWHAGFSGSIPLTISGGQFQTTGGVLSMSLPTSRTLFSSFNIFIVVGGMVAVAIVNTLMHPKLKEDIISVEPAILMDEDISKNVAKKSFSHMTPAEKAENSPIINILLAILGYAYIVYYFVSSDNFDLNLNIVNLIFLTTAILLHKTPRSLIDAVSEATKGASGIILQFPLYAGIMGIMTGVSYSTGISLGSVISNFFVSISNRTTFPLFTFLSAGIVNVFVPSGGGQWALQGPIMMSAGAILGVDSAKTAMAIAYGDSWTNMIQPFWALPALAIAKLGAKDIMGYTLIILVVTGVIVSLGLILF